MKNELIEISALEEGDIEEILKIQTECNLALWNCVDYQKAIHNNTLTAFVAKRQKEVIGFIIGRLIMNGYYYPIFQAQKSLKKLENLNQIGHKYKNEYGNEAELYNFAVAKKYQNKGVGEKLLSKFTEVAKNNRIALIWLEVRKSNINAIRFYRKNNFCASYQRKNYYNNPVEDGIVMKLIL